MTNKKLFIIVAAAILIIVAVLIFSRSYKGTLILDPKEQNSMVIFGENSYTDFPKEIKLKPGTYKLKTKKDGYIDDFSAVNVKAFKKISYSPTLNKAKIINYIDSSAFFDPVVNTETSEIFYFNAEEREFRKFGFSAKSISNPITEITLSDTLKFKDFGTQPLVRWSPDKNFASFLGSEEKIVVDLRDRTTTTAPKNVKDLAFTTEDKIIYLESSVLKQSFNDFTDPEKILDVSLDSENISLSPSNEYVAVMNKDSAQIYDLKSKKSIKKIDEKVNKVQWFNNTLLAYSYESKKGISLASLNLGNNEQKDFGLIFSNLFTWKNDETIIYTSKNNISYSLKEAKIGKSDEKTLLRFSIDEKISAILIDNKNIILGTKNLLYSLD